MSKYTTEVRYICEQYTPDKESKDGNWVDIVLHNSWDKIFTTSCEFFDNSYRGILCCKILKHYYLREIGAETVGIWKLWMNTKLEEIMPYYNQLYRSALLEFDPFKDVDYSKSHDGSNSGTSNTTGSKNGGNTRNTSNQYNDTGTVDTERDIVYDDTHHHGDRYSDTPQGTINNTDVVGDAYLTNVRLIDETYHDVTSDDSTETRNLSGTNDGSETGTYNETNSSGTTVSNVDAYLEHIAGKMNTTPYSDLLNKYRETFLNIDMMVIEEFEELFLGLW